MKLADLCAVLNKNLPKPPETRAANHWDNDVLTPTQIEYAALNAWVSLKIFNRLRNHQVIGSKLDEAVHGTIVGVYSGSSQQACAFGRLANDDDSETELKKFVDRKGRGYRSRNRTHVVVEINNVKVPGMVA
jgi:ribonuclease D